MSDHTVVKGQTYQPATGDRLLFPGKIASQGADGIALNPTPGQPGVFAWRSEPSGGVRVLADALHFVGMVDGRFAYALVGEEVRPEQPPVLPVGQAEGIAYGIRAPGSGMMYREIRRNGQWKAVFNPGGRAEAHGLPPEVDYEVFYGQGAYQIVTTRVPAIGDNWTLEQFPEFVVAGFHHKTILAAGVADLTGYQAPLGLWSRPIISAKNVQIEADGLHFDPALQSHFKHLGRDRNASMVRWVSVVFEVPDPDSTKRTNIINVAGSDDNWKNQPCMYYEKGRLHGVWEMPITGLDANNQLTPAKRVKVDVSCGGVKPGKNVGIIGTCNGSMWVMLDGQYHDRHSHPHLKHSCPPAEGPWLIGPRPSDGDNCKLILHEATVGGGELAESWFKKLSETKALEYGLPWGKAHKIEASDVYYTPRHDEPDFAKWRDENPTDAEKFFVARGKPALPVTGYTTVFHEDFRANTIGISNGANLHHCNAYGPGANLAVGGDHSNNNPQMPSATRLQNYLHDPVVRTMTMRLMHDGKKWWAPALWTVNDAGRGRAFKDGYILRTITELPYIDDPKATGGQLFPAEWSYALPPYIWQFLNRREFDFWEAHAPGGTNDANWMIALSHEAFHSSYNPDPGPNREIVNGNITPERGWPFEVRNFRGKPIMREHRVDPDWTYLSIDINPKDIRDRSGLVEFLRFPTPKILIEQGWFFIWNWSIQKDFDPNNWEPVRQDYDYTIHDVLVMQRKETVEAIPREFAERPTIALVNGKLALTVKTVTGVKHVDADWYVDAYPFASGPADKLIDPAGIKGGVRALVTLAGITDQPPCWSNTLQL